MNLDQIRAAVARAREIDVNAGKFFDRIDDGLDHETGMDIGVSLVEKYLASSLAAHCEELMREIEVRDKALGQMCYPRNIDVDQLLTTIRREMKSSAPNLASTGSGCKESGGSLQRGETE